MPGPRGFYCEGMIMMIPSQGPSSSRPEESKAPPSVFVPLWEESIESERKGGDSEVHLLNGDSDPDLPTTFICTYYLLMNNWTTNQFWSF
jgi:hypothetical protein